MENITTSQFAPVITTYRMEPTRTTSYITTSQFAPVNTTSIFAPVNTTSQFAPVNTTSYITTSQFAPVITTSQMPPVMTTSQMPPVITTSQMPPVITTSQIPSVMTTSQIPPVMTTSQIPPVMTTSQMPPVMTTSQMPPVMTTSQIPPVMTTSQIPHVMTTSQMPPVMTTSQIPPVIPTDLVLPSIIRNPYFLIDIINNELNAYNIKCGQFKVMTDSPCQDIIIKDKIQSTSNIELCYFDIVAKNINVTVDIVLNNHNDNIPIALIENIMSKYDKDDILHVDQMIDDEIEKGDIYPFKNTKQVIIFNNIKSDKNTHLIKLHKPTLLIFVNCSIPNIKVEYTKNQCIYSFDMTKLVISIVFIFIIILLLYQLAKMFSS